MKYLFRFKVIDHYSDECSPVEETVIECDNERDGIVLFYTHMDGEPVDLISVEEWKY
jgi:hypothetical protein